MDEECVGDLDSEGSLRPVRTWKSSPAVQNWLCQTSLNPAESEDRSAAPGRTARWWFRYGVAVLLIGFQFGLLPQAKLLNKSDTVAFICWAIFELLRADSSPFARNASGQLFAAWLCTLTYKLDSFFRNRSCTTFWLLHAVVGTVNACHAWAALSSIYLRVALAEEIFGMRLWSGAVGVVRECYVGVRLIWTAGAYSIALLSYLSGDCLWLPPWRVDKSSEDWYFMVVVCGGLVSWTLAFVVSARSSSIMLESAWEGEPERVLTYVEAEVSWAKTVLLRIRWAEFSLCGVYMLGYALCLVCSTLQLLGDRKAAAWAYSDGTLGAANTLCSVIVLVALLSMTNFYRPLQPDLNLPSQSEPIAAQPLRHIPNRTWHEKVQEMAQRGMEVNALLDFYGRLGPAGDAMPHFDPGRHTTNDVVRSAIIPLSRVGSGGRAYASLHAGASSGSLVECMVTHDWHNLFVHLVAAVVADALGQDEFGPIAEELERQGPGQLRRRLARQAAGDALSRSYWICAFCVNQHASICGGFGREPPRGAQEFERWHENRRDTVTGAPHACCGCDEPKILNDSADRCELNKFADMMALLADESPDFRQVIAVDREFGLFSRIWCVAEIVQAHESRIPQHVCVMSNEALALDNEDLSLYVKLANLRVVECNASRPEDKEQILAGIEDTNEFDAHLQALIFGEHGLMRHRLVGFDILHAATLSLRRGRAITMTRTLRRYTDDQSTSSDDDDDSE